MHAAAIVVPTQGPRLQYCELCGQYFLYFDHRLKNVSIIQKMAEAEAIIPENSATIPENEPTSIENSKNVAQNSETIPNNSSENGPQPVEAPASKRGRPTGSRDRAPRRKVKVEPIPVEAEPPPAVTKPAPTRAHTPEPTAREQMPPEPPSPQTLYRQTSAHLITLRDAMNDQRRSKVAEQYTSRMVNWPVV